MSKLMAIKCNRCLWEYDHKTLWECDCDHVWNVFETKGLCPVCKTQWYKIQCPSCAFPLSLEEWYSSASVEKPMVHKIKKDLFGKNSFLGVFFNERRNEKPLYEQIRNNAHSWINSRKQYLLRHPIAEMIWSNICKHEPELTGCIDQGMSQIQDNKGFDINQPLIGLDVPGFNRLIDILLVSQINRSAHLEFISQGYIIDEFDIRGELDETIKMYNKVLTIFNTD